MSIDDISVILRMQAWERAKGELEALLQTYPFEARTWVEAKDKIRDFIKDFEDNCC